MGRKVYEEDSGSESDGILHSDSEVDEFENYKESIPHGEEESADGFEESEDEGGVGMYEPDDWNAASDSDDSEEDDDEGSQMKKLRKGLDDIPLETLRKAQRGMGKAAQSDDEEGISEKERKVADMKARFAEMQRAKGKGKAVVDDGFPPGFKREREEKEAREIAKREHKHAPTVMSSKKQVSRSRQVVSVAKPDRRDPRFSSLSAGRVDADLHSRGYDFLPGMQKDELQNLKAAVAAAAKAEKTCKLVHKPKFTAEREALEKELARARSRYERTQRENREREVLAKAKREEREKRQDGKGAWYMKKAEKRDLLLKSRFESLEAEGGKRAVKKAMDKKLKKVAGKEKKSRPFAAGGGAGMEGDRKRRRVA